MTRISRSAVVLALALTPVLTGAAGCGGGDDGAPSRERPTMQTTADFTLRADLGRLDAPSWDAMVVPHEGPGIWLKPEARDSELLRPGAVSFDQPFDDAADGVLGVVEIGGDAQGEASSTEGETKPAALRPLGEGLADKAKKDLYAGVAKLLSDGWTIPSR